MGFPTEPGSAGIQLQSLLHLLRLCTLTEPVAIDGVPLNKGTLIRLDSSGKLVSYE